MRTKIAVLAFALLVLGIWSCERQNDDLLLNQKEGKVTIKLTDAPFPSSEVAEANVTISSIALKKRVHELGTDSQTGEGIDSSYFVVMEKDTTINLLDLANGITALLAEEVIPEGEYNQIRMIVTDAEIVLNDGQTFDLKIPSGSTSGIKILIKPSLLITPGDDSELLLDFDVSRSFIAQGNYHSKGSGKGKGHWNEINGFLFKPVIRAVNQVQTGQVSGQVTSAAGDSLAGATIYLLAGEDTISSAISSEVGYYAIIGVPEGTYSLDCALDGYITGTYPNVVVKAGKISERNFVLETVPAE